MKKITGIFALILMTGFAFAENYIVRTGEEFDCTPKACVTNSTLVKSIHRGSERVGKVVMEISTEKGISEIEYYLSKGSLVELYKEVEKEVDGEVICEKEAVQFKVANIRDNFVEFKKIEKKEAVKKEVVETEEDLIEEETSEEEVAAENTEEVL